MIFHACSQYVYDWIARQNHVKEESLTDWILYEISQRCNFVYYQAFSRHEEAQNGSDWEWWILTTDYSRRNNFNAYRFLVQAKKLLSDGRDNYPLISYGNKYGTQVDLLLESAQVRHALPMYMFYSTGEVDILEQINNVQYIESKAHKWCENCINGCYMSLANVVYDLLYKMPRIKVIDSLILNNSFKFSILDLFFGKTNKDISAIMDVFNNKLILEKIVGDEIYYRSNVKGIKYNEMSIPNYLQVFIQSMSSQNADLNWIEREMEITDISGLGVIDLRQIDRDESIISKDIEDTN